MRGIIIAALTAAAAVTCAQTYTLDFTTTPDLASQSLSTFNLDSAVNSVTPFTNAAYNNTTFMQLSAYLAGLGQATFAESAQDYYSGGFTPTGGQNSSGQYAWSAGGNDASGNAVSPTDMGVWPADNGTGTGFPTTVNQCVHSLNGWFSETSGDAIILATFGAPISSASAVFYGDFDNNSGIIALDQSGNVLSVGYVAPHTDYAQSLLPATATVSAGTNSIYAIAIVPGDFNNYVGLASLSETVQSVPEPAAFAVLGIGALGLISRRRKRA